MKRSKLAGALAMTMAGTVANTQAAPVRPGAAETEVKSMDTNGDGKVSPPEHAAGAQRMFDTMDADKDGKVTAGEMDAAHEKVTGRKAAPGDMSAPAKIKVVDTDGDGILTAEEHAAGSRRMFGESDTNKDGFITLEELASAHARMMGKSAR